MDTERREQFMRGFFGVFQRLMVAAVMGFQRVDGFQSELDVAACVGRRRAPGKHVPGLLAVRGKTDRIAVRRIALNMKHAGDDMKRQDDPGGGLRHGHSSCACQVTRQ
ncbi:hypothetical protein ACS8Y6_00345 [Salinisphaera sp. RV14]|uniref:hypothetical protein n=1 Tax=Salinisphaera sp. RV14 TaxID=3454140 RepID=UPI003F824405